MKNIWLLWLLLIIFAGCSAERAASRKLMRADRQSKYAVAEWCARLYPPVALVKDSISYLPGKAELVYVSVDCDSLSDDKNNRRLVKVPCPESRTVDTIVVYKEKHLVNTALVDNLQKELHVKNEQFENAVKHRNLLLILLGGFFIYFIARYFIKRKIIFQ